MAGNWEKTLVPPTGKPQEDSGVRSVSKKDEEKETESYKHIAGLTPEETSRAIDAKVAEEHPEDPFQSFGPNNETDTAKVWGVTDLEALDKEDKEHARTLREKLAAMDEASKDLPEDDFDRALKEGLKKRAS